MSFSSLIDTVEEPSRQLSLSAETPSSHAVDAIADFFDVSTVTHSTRDQPDLILSEDDTKLVSGAVGELYDAVTSTAEILQTESTTHPDALNIIDRLETTTFHSQNTRQLLVASRYVERQAERAGGGTLYSCFQKLSRLQGDPKTRLYYSVLADSEVDVHVFGIPDASLANADELTVHSIDTAEIASAWLTVYDGNGNDEAKTAVLAEEVTPNEYEGFWTVDPTRVEAILNYLSDIYLS